MAMRTPKYQLIEQELREEILSGRFESGDLFYSEAELIRRFDVSSITIVRAIRDLVSLGYLVRRQGKGTFVSRARKRQLVEFSDIEVFSSRDVEEQIEVLRCEPGDDPEVRATLGLTSDEGYHEIVRRRTVNDTPFIVQYSHIPSALIKEDTGPAYYTSIYERLREDHGLHLFEEPSVEVDDIVFPAPAHVARALRLAGNVPCMRQHKITTLRSGQVVEDIVSYKRWDFCKFEISAPGAKVPASS